MFVSVHFGIYVVVFTAIHGIMNLCDLCGFVFRHEKYVTQYRAVFVVNCNTKNEQVPQQNTQKSRRRKRGRDCSGTQAGAVGGETFRQVCCSVCSTEVGVIDEEEVYHFFNVLPSES